LAVKGERRIGAQHLGQQRRGKLLRRPHGQHLPEPPIGGSADGMGWDGMGWDGMGWDGMGWDGMGWDGMGWDGMGWDGMGRGH
jgi:hypothetical protein